MEADSARRMERMERQRARFVRAKVGQVLAILPRGQAIRVLLEQQGISLSEIARTMGVTRPAISGVTNGHFRSSRIEAHIAFLLGVPEADLFPPRALNRASVARPGRAVNGEVKSNLGHRASENEFKQARRQVG